MVPYSEHLSRLGHAPTAHRYIAEPLEAVAFWTAVLLPLTYLPLFWAGLATDAPMALLTILFVNAVAAIVGHGHQVEAERRPRR